MDAYPSVDPEATPPKLSHGANIAIQNEFKPVREGIGHSEIAVMAYPVKVELDTPTDWPAILLPIALGVAAFYFTRLNQQQQIRSSIASNREAWLKDLRAAAVEFAASAAEVHLGFLAIPNYKKSPDHLAVSARLFRAGATIQLMLDKKHPENEEVIEAINEVIQYTDVTGGNYFSDALEKFNEKAQFVLEDAWKDIQRDLGHRPSWRESLKKYLKRKHPHLYAKLYGP